MMVLITLASLFVAGSGVQLQRLGAPEIGAFFIAAGAASLAAGLVAMKGGAA